MGITAAPWQLPYPDAGDRPENGADVLYRLADRMDYHLTNWRADDDRLRRRPAAKVTYDSTVRYKVNSTAQSVITYNNVQLDTFGMTDLQRRADRIYLPGSPRPALYAVGGTVVGLSAVTPSVPDIRLTSNARWSIDTVPNPDVPYPYTSRDQNQDRGDTTRGETFQVSTIINVYKATDGAYDDEIWIGMECNSGTDFTVWYADMWAFWVTDVGTIPST